MVVFDASFLIFLLDPNITPPNDPATDLPISNSRERIELLVKTLSDNRNIIIIPTPALSELMVHADAAMNDWLEILEKSRNFRIVDFDKRAAIEAALAIQDAIAAGDKRGGGSPYWQKCKFDRQIVAIGRVENATAIYSTDGDVRRYAAAHAISAYHVADLPEPPEHRQPQPFPGDA